jgi:8-oxo-dGTP pyrophosphatase MutT (NUDIX family)
MAPRPPLPGWTPDHHPATARKAAALVLLYEADAGPTLALTLRRDDLPHHPGQLSLPGGALDPGETPATAALREAEEEIGVSPDSVQLVGSLSTLWIPVSNFILYPFVGVSLTPPIFAPHAAEVAALVPMPLAWLHDQSRRRWFEQERRDTIANVPYFDVPPHRLWGATAMVLAELGEVLRNATTDDPGA